MFKTFVHITYLHVSVDQLWIHIIRSIADAFSNSETQILLLLLLSSHYKTIPVSLPSTSFCLNLSVLIQHLTRPISVVEANNCTYIHKHMGLCITAPTRRFIEFIVWCRGSDKSNFTDTPNNLLHGVCALEITRGTKE